jgi:phosphatidylserine/phosphatidylglycerophosphate/cardiolipin synthase-like enzyme
MGVIKSAGAWSNGEVAYVAWQADKRIPDCLGFMATRVHETGPDAGARRVLPTWIAFTDQSNPDWEEQDASVWPIQSFEWRDLTLRKSRNTTNVRPIDFKVHYEITAVGLAGPGRKPVPTSQTAVYKDANGKPRYTGTPRPLFLIDDGIATNSIDVTHKYSGDKAAVQATFTNGILSTQNLLKQLESAKVPLAKPKLNTDSATPSTGEQHLLSVLKSQIVDKASPIRLFLTGDALAFLRQLLERADTDGGQLYMAIYELHDPELIELLKARATAGQVHLILSTASSTDPNPKGTSQDKKQPVVWDVENDPVRADLHAIKKCDIQDRMFNLSGPIGHNKFVVYVKNGKAEAVLTGSTNWTETGLCTQSNNAIIIENAGVADLYWKFWERLRADVLPKRVAYTAQTAHGPIKGSKPNKANQGAKLRGSNATAFGPVQLPDGSNVMLWCSPNTTTNRKTDTSPIPGDLADVYQLMNGAKEAILFLTFLPGESGKQNIIGEAATLAQAKPGLLVMGAISDPTAMPNYVRVKKGEPDPDAYVGPDGKQAKLPPRAIWWPGGDTSRIVMIRAAAVRIPIGNLRPELLTAGHAIIHDKIIVIDPLDKARCVVITGSHNLGYKASYDNDENLLIIKGNRDLAVSYAVHVLDIYNHYLLRAKLEDQMRTTLKSGKQPQPDAGHGFLRTTDQWQDRFFPTPPASSLDYFLKHLP